MLCFGIMFVYLFWLLRRNGVMKFFTFPWNVLDVINILLWGYYINLRLVGMSGSSSDPNLHPDKVGHPNLFMPFSQFFVSLQLANRTLAFLTLFMYLKIMKYSIFFGWFRLLQQVVMKCMTKLVFFGVLIVVMFMGFGLAFFVGVGRENGQYSTL